MSDGLSLRWLAIYNGFVQTHGLEMGTGPEIHLDDAVTLAELLRTERRRRGL